MRSLLFAFALIAAQAHAQTQDALGYKGVPLGADRAELLARQPAFLRERDLFDGVTLHQGVQLLAELAQVTFSWHRISIAPPVRGVLAFLVQALLAFFYRRC